MRLDRDLGQSFATVSRPHSAAGESVRVWLNSVATARSRAGGRP